MTLRIGIIVFVLSLFMSADSTAQRKIQWRSWEDVEKLQKENPKKILVDIYTEWCGWCKKMDKATFQKDHIAKYVNENYYAVKFDAEHKEQISFDGKVYKYVKNGRKGYNELAVALTRGQLSFPTIVFLSEDNKILQPIPGFQDAATFEMISTYFGENHFKDTPWKRYTSTYKRNSLKGIPVKN